MQIRNFQSLTGTVPTATQKAGVFATAITDPTTGQPFPNNTIPASRISPVAQKLMALYPDPNTVGAFNFTSPNSSANFTDAQVLTKFDVRVSDSDRWSGTFAWDSNPNPTMTNNAIAMFTRGEPNISWIGTINNTRTFGSRLVNNFGVHFLRRLYLPGTNSASPANFASTLGIQGFPNNPSDYFGVPIVSVTNLLPLGDGSIKGTSTLGIWEIRDDVSFDKGAHSLKFGYHWRREYEGISYNGRSSFSFNQFYTGNAAANLLLGIPSSVVQGSDDQRGRYGQNGQYLYSQDSWKVSSTLTLDLGLRYEYRGPWEDERGFMSNFNPATGQLFPPLQNLTLQPWQTGRFQTNVPLISWNKRGWEPRIGLAYRIPSLKSVIRAGYGIYSNEPLSAMVQFLGWNPRPNAVPQTFQASAAAPTLSLSNPFNPSSLVPGSGLPNLYASQTPLPQSYVYNWGITIQRELTPDLVVEAGYQGNQSIHAITISQFNDATPGTGNRQLRRPYPLYQNISMLLADGSSNYNALELKAEKRAGKSGLFGLVAYTWSKALDTVGGRLGVADDNAFISRNVSLEHNRGRAEGNIPGRFAMTAGYELPFGKGKPLLTQGLGGRLLGGWSVYGIFTVTQGPYLTPSLSVNFLDSGSTASVRPDVLRNPNLPTSQQSVHRWFDTSAFIAPSPLVYGNAGRSIIQGPGLTRLDASLLRSFRTSETTRLEFRFEAFNATNHTAFGLPDITFGSSTFGVIGSAFDSRDLQLGLKFYF